VNKNSEPDKISSMNEVEVDDVSNRVIIDSSSSNPQITEEDDEREESTIVIDPEPIVEVEPQTTRSGRQINPPAHLNDFVVRRE